MAILVTIFAVVVALLAVLTAGLLRSHAEILRELHGLGVDLDPDRDGTAVPSVAPLRADGPREGSDISGVDPDGDAVSIAVVGARHPTLLAFLTSTCTTCVEFWNAFADSSKLRVPAGARLVVVTKGEEAESPPRVRKFAPPDVPVVMSTAAWEAYDAPVAPYFAFVEAMTGRIVGEGAASTWPQLVNMLEQALVEAGIDPRGRRTRRASNRERTERVDRELAAAGIEPGDPSLYPRTLDDLHEQPGS